MNKNPMQRVVAGTLSAAAAVSCLTLATAAVSAKQASPPGKMTVIIPRDVLVFPATINTGAAAVAGDTTTTAPQLTVAQKQAQDIVTNAFREHLSRADIGVVVYNKRLPSVQRAVSEGLKAEDAAAGPGDDTRKALRFAQIVGAAEYLTIDVTNYKYDSASRTASFNVNVFRNSVEDEGAPLATVAKPATGAAPADVAVPRQEGSALARASAQVAEETFQDLYPQVAQLQAAKTTKNEKKK
ncbi:MAG: hypothetical protein H7Z41_06765 [Cytophagales bacterium]|nr:hypothetical protein [Armatimonadota bacterium]